MSNSMTDDYFAYMSDKSTRNLLMPEPLKVALPKNVAVRVEKVAVIKDTPIEVTESFVSDTMIQRIFKPQSGA